MLYVNRCDRARVHCQGEGRRFEPGVPLHMAPESLRISGPSSFFGEGDAHAARKLLTRHGNPAAERVPSTRWAHNLLSRTVS